jgi:hypothetical protein
MSLTTMTELWRLSATDLVEAIRSRQTSSQEVIEAHLRRIEAVNPSINAVTVVLGEHPLQAAKAADRAVAGGGVPTDPTSGRPVAGAMGARPTATANLLWTPRRPCGRRPSRSSYPKGVGDP